MHDIPSHPSDYLCLVWKKSIQNCKSYKADMKCGTDGQTDGQMDGMKTINPTPTNFVAIRYKKGPKIWSPGAMIDICLKVPLMCHVPVNQVSWSHSKNFMKMAKILNFYHLGPFWDQKGTRNITSRGYDLHTHESTSDVPVKHVP